MERETNSYPALCPGLPEFRQWAWVTDKQVAPMCLLFLNRQSSKSGRILILDLKTCVKEKKRMAVPSLVPSIVPVLKLLILSQKSWRFKQWNSLFSQLTTHSYFLTPWWHQQRTQCQSPCPTGEALGQAAVTPTSVLQEKAAAHPLQLKPVVARTAPYSSQGSVQFWAIPGHKCTVMACSAQHMPSCGRSNGKF